MRPSRKCEFARLPSPTKAFVVDGEVTWDPRLRNTTSRLVTDILYLGEVQVALVMRGQPKIVPVPYSISTKFAHKLASFQSNERMLRRMPVSNPIFSAFSDFLRGAHALALGDEFR